jgi:hypothetical protein
VLEFFEVFAKVLLRAANNRSGGIQIAVIQRTKKAILLINRQRPQEFQELRGSAVNRSSASSRRFRSSSILLA